MEIPIGKSRVRGKPKNITKLIPIPEAHLVFNMNDEPAFKYSIINIADKGFDENVFLSKKLDKFVLYLETKKREKYEINKCKFDITLAADLEYFDVYRVAKIKNPYQADN